MAFLPKYHHSHYNLFNELPEFSTPATGGDGCGLAMWCEENLPLSFDNNGAAHSFVPSESGITSPISSYMSFPERLGVSDMVVPALPEFSIGSSYGPARNHPAACEFGDECSGLVSNLWRDCHSSSNNLEIQRKPVQEIEERTLKVGRYSVEERKDRILKYLKKRNQRNFNKTIKYACRKTLADKRIRVRGRFAKNNEPHEGDALTENNDTQKEEEIFYNDEVKIKHDEEDWLQEAMASFMYLPYISGPML